MQQIDTFTRKMIPVAAVGSVAVIFGLAAAIPLARAEDSKSTPANLDAHPTPAPGVPPESLGISFVDGSTTTMMMEHKGKKYLVDLASHRIKEVDEAGADPQPRRSRGRRRKTKTTMLAMIISLACPPAGGSIDTVSTSTSTTVLFSVPPLPEKPAGISWTAWMISPCHPLESATG